MRCVPVLPQLQVSLKGVAEVLNAWRRGERPNLRCLVVDFSRKYGSKLLLLEAKTQLLPEGTVFENPMFLASFDGQRQLRVAFGGPFVYVVACDSSFPSWTSCCPHSSFQCGRVSELFGG